MKEPDPPDDLEQTILETFDELHAEAKIVPMVLLFPPEVIECIKTYTKEHSLDPRPGKSDSFGDESHNTIRVDLVGLKRSSS